MNDNNVKPGFETIFHSSKKKLIPFVFTCFLLDTQEVLKKQIFYLNHSCSFVCSWQTLASHSGMFSHLNSQILKTTIKKKESG